MSKKILLCACLLLAQTVALGSETYRFSRPIEWQGSGQQELLTVPLDNRVYAATRDGFPDLRLVDQDGIELPLQPGHVGGYIRLDGVGGPGGGGEAPVVHDGAESLKLAEIHRI